MEKNNESPLKIVHKSDEVKKGDGQKPLSHEELMAKLSTLGTVQEREQAVIDNLRRKGL